MQLAAQDRLRLELVSAATDDRDFLVFGMDLGFHDRSFHLACGRQRAPRRSAHDTRPSRRGQAEYRDACYRDVWPERETFKPWKRGRQLSAPHRVEELCVALGGFDLVEEEFHRREVPLVPRRPQAWGGNERRPRVLDCYPRRIESKNSALLLVALILSRRNSIASRSSIGYSSLRRIH